MSAELIFGKYQIQQRLAVGGMGEVFFASQTGVAGFERPVILKNLLPDLAQQEGFVEQFLDEARVAATLNHPNVVSIFEVGLWNGTYFIAMEFIRGRNLSQVIRGARKLDQRVPPRVAAQWVRDAALGLHHAHIAIDPQGQPLNIVHRDISPQNVMVRDDGVTKVVDFGIARAANRASRTATGALKGKLAYMAPEQVEGNATPASDQYSLGVVLWELCTCQRLFQAEQEIELLKKVLSGQIPPLSQLVPDIPKDLEQVVAKMLEPDPARRYRDCAEAAKAIDAVVKRLEATRGSVGVEAFLASLGPSDSPSTLKTPHSSGANFVIPFRPSSPSMATREHRPAEPLPPPPLREGEGKTRLPLLAGLFGIFAFTALAAAFLQGPKPTTTPPELAPVAGAQPAPLEKPVVAKADPLATATWRIRTVPAGAQVRFDGRPLGVSPVEVSALAAAPHMLRLERAGFRTDERELPPAKPGEPHELEVTLEAQRPNVRPAPVPTSAPVAAAPAGPGLLSLSTVPWTQVTLDGEPLGTTPLFKVKVRAGRHTLKLSNPGKGVEKTQSVDIVAGEVSKLDLKF